MKAHYQQKMNATGSSRKSLMVHLKSRMCVTVEPAWGVLSTKSTHVVHQVPKLLNLTVLLFLKSLPVVCDISIHNSYLRVMV